MLRVIVVPNGHGAQYMLSLEDTLAEDDLVLYESGIRVIADEDSAPLLQGASIDYSEGLMRSGLRHREPQHRHRWRMRMWVRRLRMRLRRRRLRLRRPLVRPPIQA